MTLLCLVVKVNVMGQRQEDLCEVEASLVYSVHSKFQVSQTFIARPYQRKKSLSRKPTLRWLPSV